MQNHLKHELHNVLSGKSQVRFGAIIQSISSYLNDGAQTGAIIEDEKLFKKQETKRLESYISEKNLTIDIDLSQYVSEGAEQKVYLKDTENVLKLDDNPLGEIFNVLKYDLVFFKPKNMAIFVSIFVHI